MMLRLSYALFGLLFGLLTLQIAVAQAPTGAQTQIGGVANYRSTTNSSVVITSGTVFQTVLSSVIGTTVARQSLTIQNNNTSTDNCWVFIGSGTATAGKSIILAPGAAYTRYFPYVPPDAIQATCLNTSDTLYVDTQ